MERCAEEDAKAVSAGLTLHARNIYAYAATFCLPGSANMSVAEDRRAKFRRTVRRMLKEMRALLLLARYKGVSRFCNMEQIEAYMEASNSILKSPEDANPVDIPVFNRIRTAGAGS
jgi:hypothetical protein